MSRDVQAALALWGMEGASARLIAERENSVWKIEHEGSAYALRFHRPGYRNLAELQSELQWMAMLAEGGVSVPRPIPLLAGGFTGMKGTQAMSMLSWMGGAPIGEAGALFDTTDPRALAVSVGREMARMHDLTDAWELPEGFTRPDWRREGLLGEDPLWGRFWEHPHLTAAQRNLFLKARAKADARLRDTGDALDQGLIHADLLCENVMLDAGQPVFIDFDDSVFGYRDFELATFLKKSMHQPYFAEMRAGVLEGYSTRRVVTEDALDFALLLRALTYPGWIISRLDEPGNAERSARQLAQALELAETFVTT